MCKKLQRASLMRLPNFLPTLGAGARKAVGEADKAPDNTYVSITADVEMEEASNEELGVIIHPAMPEVQPTANLSEHLLQLLESEASDSSDDGKLFLEDAIAGIILPLSRSAKEMDPSDDSSADLAFVKTMAASFKDVQERYSRRWEKLQMQQQAVELAE